MHYRILGLSALLTLLLATAAPAQTTTTEDTATATEETSVSEEPAASEVDEAFPVEEASENQGAETGEYLKSTHGDWQVLCLKAQEEGAKENCRLYNLLKDADGNSVAEFIIIGLPKGSKAVAGVTVVTPLGTMLTAKLSLKVDNGKAAKYDFAVCEQLGCVSRFGMTQGAIDAMKRGATATVSLVAFISPKEPINLEASLTGFTAAWNEISG